MRCLVVNSVGHMRPRRSLLLVCKLVLLIVVWFTLLWWLSEVWLVGVRY